MGFRSPLRRSRDHWCVSSILLYNSGAHSGLPVGTRLGITDHTEDNFKVFQLRLTDQDRAVIEDVLDRSNGRRLITAIGDCGAEYR